MPRETQWFSQNGVRFYIITYASPWPRVKDKFHRIRPVADLASAAHDVADEILRFLPLLTPMNWAACNFPLTSGTGPNELNLTPSFFLGTYPVGFVAEKQSTAPRDTFSLYNPPESLLLSIYLFLLSIMGLGIFPFSCFEWTESHCSLNLVNKGRIPRPARNC